MLQAWEEVCKLSVSPSLQRKARKGAGRIGTSRKLWKEKKVVTKDGSGSRHWSQRDL
jgi:hypothetical protein